MNSLVVGCARLVDGAQTNTKDLEYKQGIVESEMNVELSLPLLKIVVSMR